MQDTQADLQTISESGQAPKRRIKSVEAARSIASQIIEGDKERDRIEAKIKGMIDGNPPFNEAKLRAAGQAYRTNINFLEGKAALSSALVPYYDLFSSTPHFVEIQTAEGDAVQKTEWSRVIVEEFDQMLKDYDAFDFNMQAMLHDFVGFGRGFLFWKDEYDWQFDHIPRNRVKVANATRCNPKATPLLLITQNIDAQELFGFIDKEDQHLAGWKREAVLDAIRDACPKSEYENEDYVELQRKLRDKDLETGLMIPKVPIAHLYVKEFSGKITHMIIALSSKKKEGRTDDFLYIREEKYSKMPEAIATFFLETLDGSWNGASGLGRDIYAPIEIKNRLKCAALDNAFLRSGIVLQAKSEAALQKTSLIQMGVMNIIPPDYEVMQATIFGDIETGIKMDNHLEMMLASNTGVYRQKMEKPTGNPRTAEEVRLQYQSSAVLGSSAVNRFYTQLDRFFGETYRRASAEQIHSECDGVQMAKAFQKRCTDRGVPLRAIRNVKFVRAFRNIGNGSVFMRQQAVTGMFQFYPMLPEIGKQRLLQDAVAALTNQEMVERYAPSASFADTPTDHHALANLENAVMKVGAPVVWTPTQNNVVHAQTHIEACAAALNSLQQGAGKEEIWAFLEMAGPHVAIHLNQLAADPTRKEEFKALNAQFMQVSKLHDQLSQQIKAEREQAALDQFKQQQAQQVQAGLDPETQIQVAKTQNDIALKNMKAQQILQQKQEKHELQMNIAKQKNANAK